MPVRIQIPKTGHRLEYSRYWLEKDRTAHLSVAFVRSWFLTPIWIFLAVVFALGLALAIERRLPAPHWRFSDWRAGVAMMVVTLWPVWKIGHGFGFVVTVMLGCLLAVLPFNRAGRLWGVIRGWMTGVATDFRTSRAEPKAKFNLRLLFSRVVIGWAMFFLALALFSLVVRVLFLLTRPLA